MVAGALSGTLSSSVRDRDELSPGQSRVGLDDLSERGLSLRADGLGVCVVESVGAFVLGIYASSAARRARLGAGVVSSTAFHQVFDSRLGAALRFCHGQHRSCRTFVMKFGSTEADKIEWGNRSVCLVLLF